MAKLEWMENDKPHLRNFDFIMVQQTDGTEYKTRFAGRLVLVEDGELRVLKAFPISPSYRKPEKRGVRWVMTFVLMGIWATLMIQMLMR